MFKLDALQQHNCHIFKRQTCPEAKPVFHPLRWISAGHPAGVYPPGIQLIDIGFAFGVFSQ